MTIRLPAGPRADHMHPGTAIPPEQLFTLKAGEGRYLVAAHSMRVEENDLQYHESLLRDRLL